MMSELNDMCRAVKVNKISFVLNPQDCWHAFDEKFDSIVNSQDWQEMKFLNESADAINEKISEVPNNKGGVYIFFLRPDIVPVVHKYILYVGRVQCTEYQNLRKRFREYLTDTRVYIELMRETWGKDLYIRYLPLTDNELIKSLEKELIRVIIPPYNSEYPGILNKAVKAAF